MSSCQICTKGIHVTKRDMFYTDVKLFKVQIESDAVLEEAAAMLGCTRASLNGDSPLNAAAVHLTLREHFSCCRKPAILGAFSR